MRRCPKCNSFFDNSVDKCIYDGDALVEVQVEAPPTEGLEGQIINDRYTVGTAIGEGGMGMVYKAIDKRTGDDLALKVLHRDISGDDRTVKRFFSEARLLSSLTHPNIIELYDFGKTDDGLLYIAMELLEGDPVDELIHNKKLDQRTVLQILDQTAAALAEAHGQSVIHRDLKPANIFLKRKEGGDVHVTVLDFGIAKISGSGQNLTATGKVMGTPSYMAPEQIRGGEPDPRTDIYALGAMGYELLSGNPPFVADGPIAVLFMHLERPPDPLKGLNLSEPVSDALSKIFDRFLAKEPDDRPRNMMDVRALLKPFLLGEEPSDELKETMVFNTADAIAKAKERIAEQQEAKGDDGVPTDKNLAVTQKPEESTAAVPHIMTNAPQDPKPHIAIEAARRRLPPEAESPPTVPFRTPPEPAHKTDGGLPISWWIGAVVVVIVLAAALAVVVFFVLNQQGEKATSGDRSVPALIAPDTSES